MKNLKSSISIFTILCVFFLGTSFAQSQETLKGIYWDGKNLEFIELKVDTINLEIQELYHQETVHSDKVKIEIKEKDSEDKYSFLWAAINPNTQEKFEVSLGMTIMFGYPNGQEKEFLRVLEYINGDEKIMVGSSPILGNIIYQKGDNSPELWLEDADFACDIESEDGIDTFHCNFTTAKGEDLELMIDQHNNSISLWRGGEKIEFRTP